MSTMLDLRQAHVHEWRTPELLEMLRHQLAAPLQLSLGSLSAEVAHQLRLAQADPLMTLDQLLRDPHPPVELLKLVKRFAKLCMRDRENPLPSDIVALLYYASIAAARVRGQAEITALTPAKLTRGLTWLRGQSWVTDEMRRLFDAALEQLEAGPPPPPH
jgi:hypothetical protein